MTDSATQSASPPVKIYHGSETIPIGRRFEPKPSFFWGCTNGKNLLRVEGALFPREKEHPPLSKNDSAVRATRYDDIPFGMGKHSRTREMFELDEL
jgi:hypothetical protein